MIWVRSLKKIPHRMGEGFLDWIMSKLDQAHLAGFLDRFDPVVDIQLGIDVAHMRADGGWCDNHFIGDLRNR